MRTSILALIPAALLTLSPAVHGSDLPDPDAPGLSPTERLDALVSRVQLEQAKLSSLEARFTQRKESMLLVEPEISEGRVSYQAPDRARWEFLSPTETVVIVREGEMLTWYRDLDRAEHLFVGRQADQVLQYMSASNSLETLMKYFTVRARFPEDPDAPFEIQLEPRYKRVRKRLESMALRLDRKLFVPLHLRYVEADGDITELDFHDVTINPELPDEHFDTTLPDEVKVREIRLDENAP